MLGEVDLDQEVFALKKVEDSKRRVDDKIRGRRFNDLWGGEMENSGEVLF
jgi:hypothetical protein